MTPDQSNGEPAVPRRRSWLVTRWALWGLPSRLLAPVLLVETVAVLLVVIGLVDHRSLVSTDHLWIGLALCLLGLAHTEIAVGVERIRRRVTDGNHVDLSSVWTFAATLILPGTAAALVAIVVHLHLWWRAWRLRVPPYRQLFTSATVVLACFASSAALAYASGDGIGAVALALLAYTTVNSCLVAGAIAVSSPHASLSKVFATWDENVLEIATLCLGALTAIAVAINIWLVLLILPPLIVLHRAVLVRQLQEAASTDGKTGLLNAAAWHTQAERALRRPRRGEGARGVLVLDLDHFKSVNDTYGHLAGDHVLAAVAEALRDEVRERDLVGRFGGEEFVVLVAALPGEGTAEIEAVAERMRRRVTDLRVEIPTPDGPLTVSGLTVSIGGAVHGPAGHDLRALLQIADTALYAAKGAGRNLVRMGLAPAAALLPQKDTPVGAHHPARDDVAALDEPHRP